MSEPSAPITFSAIETKQALAEAKELIAQQVEAEDSFQESSEEAYNPAVAERTRSRLDRFRSLEARTKTTTESKEARVEGVEKKAEEDLTQRYNQRNPELPADKLRDLRAQLRDKASPDEVLRNVERFFRDPTLADEALEYLSNVTEGPLKESVLRARMMLNDQKSREIIAGRNIDPAAKTFHEKGVGSSPTELRELYRMITDGTERDHNLLFTELSNRYPFDDLKMVVAFLLKGLGFDLKAKGPSIQTAELLRLMTEVRNLQSILWVYLFFKGRLKMMRGMLEGYDLSEMPSLSFEQIAKEFIRLVEERYPQAAKLMAMAEKMGFKTLEEKIVLISQWRDATRQLSMRLYKSPKQRQDLMLVILETLEELEEKIEEEEEEKENKERS